MNRLVSTDPALGGVVWEGEAAGAAEVAAAVERARAAFAGWSLTPLAARIAHARAFAEAVKAGAEPLARTIAAETGKPLWEARTEVATVAAKVEASIAAQAERAGERASATGFGQAVLRHRPHGVMAVLGPYNFPAHLPNGHIVPALLAGDTMVFKPSEETPATGAAMVALWAEAGLPPGVIELVQGGRDTGAALVAGGIDGLLFTGSAAAGAQLRRALVDRPEVILALELGGNNPLIAWDGDPEAVASIVVQSAFVTTGQRCTCARRLIVPEGAVGERIVDAVVALADRLRIGAWDEQPEPAIGPLISQRAAQLARAAAAALPGRVIRPMAALGGRGAAFVTTGLVDVTGAQAPDEEVFAPLLQVTRVPNFDAAIAAANATRFGLAGGLISGERVLWERYVERARAGVVNWNRPTTGAAGTLPFGGIGASGNHRAAAWYAADYCAFPIASFEADAPRDLTGEIRGLI